ncbi:hypothetical protein ERO13_D09G176700v2 [Gossypium hirsutum]|uniref:Bifunctional inhibitor/plant lipid transfer protein/seed storage helical domain-containing protein n=3 Tax=Gossypium TaxID=3633 RepID=A0A5J5QAV5_GOSBA|nr:hypothetical protein ES319_D09G197100v1 [Gossypium barbadense]KAG4130945.1 hypothetical protein ERO13_D09G176700v2 [Gossypium hirsutum]PPD71783.1 hypothetical protein GOBAR_DD31310 [Gossypium barbadense]TYG54740.1 hypothetical protein ES288_D09G215100v1 [Gossypium darwinii]TYI66122.1 hypothetical protein E1A91_D09G203300v1 [Gossypium mustelinum]
MKRFSLIVLCVVTLVVVLFSGAEAAPAPKCDNPLEYSSCLNAYKKPPPSAGCCQKMKEQAPCYCEYMKIEDVKRVFDRVEIAKMAKLCGVSYSSTC